MIRLAEPKMRSIGESNSQVEAAVIIITDMEAMANSWTPMTCLTFSFSELRLRGEGKPPANTSKDSISADKTSTREKKLTGLRLCDKWPLS